MRLLIATRNRHKLDEIRTIFSLPGLQLCSLDDFEQPLPEVEEDGATFAENAAKKARTLCQASGLWTLADDSGLEVLALGGAPGVFSARYAGVDADDAANNRKLLAVMAHESERRARFCCVLALAAPDGRSWSVTGVCEGVLLHQPQGATGFGYDPLFKPDGYEQSFAAMGAAEKNRISHRARALVAAQQAWQGLITAGGRSSQA